MHSFKIEDAAFAGVGILGRKPVSALVWALMWTILFAVVALPFAGMVAEFVTTVVKYGPNADPATILESFGGVIAFFILFGICSLVLNAIISCAVYRSVMYPEDSDYAYIRLGDQELFVLLVFFVRSLILFFANIGMSILLVILMTVLSGGHPSPGGALQNLGQLVIYCVIIWLQLRFVLAGPMTFAERHFRLFEAWEVTHGLVLRLLAVGLILFLIGAVVYLALGTLGIGVGLSLWNSEPRPADIQSLLSQSPAVWIGALAPFIALGGVLAIIGGAILTPVTVAPWAHVYKQLAEASEATAETFT